MATISDEVKSFFTGDASGLVNAVAKANAALDSNAKKERASAIEAKRAYDSRASSIKGAFINPTGAAVDGLNKFVSSMKLSAVTTGVLGAGISLAADKFSELRTEALAARRETEAFNDSFRKTFQGNVHMSGAQSSDTLMGKLADLREQQTTLKQRSFDLNVSDTSAAGIMLRARYNAEDPIHADDNLQRDRDQVKMQLYGNNQQQTAIQKDITDSLTRQNDLVREGVKGGEAQVRIKELQAAREREIAALRDTTANNPRNLSAIRARYKEQIQSAKEAGAFREKQYQRDVQAIGINRSLSTEEEKRVRLLQQEVDGLDDQLRTGQHINYEQRQALDIQLGQKQQELRVAQADVKIAESQFNLAQKTVDVNATNLNVRAKAYQTEMATLAALREQYDAVAKLNTTKARGLEISIDENENAVRLMRQDVLYGKSNSEIQKEIQRNRMDKINRDKFDKRQNRDDGLIDLHRGMDGSIIDGLDPISGERRAPRAGTGQGEQGLHAGSLSDPAMSTTGGASLTRNADPNGGLSSGRGGSMFGGVDLFQQRHNALIASGAMSGVTVADRLASSSANGFGDPIARMNQAPTFPNLLDNMRARSTGAAFLAGSSPKFSATQSTSTAALALSAKHLLQEQETTAAVNRVQAAVMKLPGMLGYE